MARRGPSDESLDETLPGVADVDVTAETVVPEPSAKGRAELAELHRGGALDHFVVLEEIGAGGMGVVLAAYDPDLDRKVAIKLLRTDGGDATSGPTARVRLLREAQALAKLSHPNVITIYEVASLDDRVAIVMEYIDGQTLGGWLASARRTQREIIQTFLLAGRGLAAAHQAGLVHRDFKPDNVLVGRDGRVRVTDFGLVSVDGTVEDPSDVSFDGTPRTTTPVPRVSLSGSITHAGALVGTPAYMSPEQLSGHRSDAKSDQFSFCVALYEALYGQGPFEGARLLERRANIRDGKLRPPPAGASVPSWLRAIVLRGLRADPGERHESMDALLAALTHDPRQRRVRLAAGAGVLALAAAAVIGPARSPDPTTPALCTGAERKLAGVWDDAVRGKLRAAFLASERPHARATVELVSRGLDRSAASWVSARTDACEATHVRREQSERLLDLRMGCLDRRLGELRALTALFGDDRDPAVLDKAVLAVANLTPPEVCADAAALSAAAPLPDDPLLRARVTAARERLDAVAALRLAGRYKPGIELARAAVADANQLAFAPVKAEALQLLATMMARGGDPKTAETDLYQALRAAADAQDHGRVADIWIDLMFVIGSRQSQPDRALALEPAAQAAIAQAGGNDARRASLATTLGLAFHDKGDFERAKQEHLRALAIQERLLGATSPRVALTLGNLANAFARQGRHAEARAHYQRALAIQEAAVGPLHPDVASTLNNMANVVSLQGDNVLGEKYFERALAIWEKALPANHPLVAMCLTNLGSTSLALGKVDAARAQWDRALAMFTATFGDEHPAVAAVLANLGGMYADSGAFAKAIDHCGRALPIYEATMGKDHVDVAYALTCLGRSHLGLRKPAVALPLVRRALALRVTNPDEIAELAEARFLLARALWATGTDRAQALVLARESLAAYEAAGPHQQKQHDDVAATLAAWAPRTDRLDSSSRSRHPRQR